MKHSFFFIFLLFTEIVFAQINDYSIISVNAQLENDIKLFENIFEVNDSKTHYNNFKNSDNEIEQIVSILFISYKKIISSQDANHCVFYPSCSSYTIQSIKKNGIIGIFDGMDRLSRCNIFSQEKYNKYKNTKLLYDPVR